MPTESRLPVSDKMAEITALCNQLETNIGGAHWNADQIIAAANRSSEVATQAMKFLAGIVDRNETFYNLTQDALTTKWEAALGTKIYLSLHMGRSTENDWQKTLESIAFFGSVHHSGYGSEFGQKRADNWKYEIDHVRPGSAQIVDRLIAKYSTPSAVPVQEAVPADQIDNLLSLNYPVSKRHLARHGHGS